MRVLAYLAAVLMLLLAASVVFRRVRRDYLDRGKLTGWTLALQLALFIFYGLLVQWGLIEVG